MVLVKDKTGYKNLSELITLSYTEGFYRKPRIDKESLEKHKEGLLIMSACVQGEIPMLLLRGQKEQAYEAAKWYKDQFGEDYYIEVQNHGLPIQVEVLPDLIQLAKDLEIPLVASNDVHYLDKDDADAREILICLQTNNVLSDPNRPMKKQTEEMYLKSFEEMNELFKDIPEAITNTHEIAAKCNFDFVLGEYTYPEFDVPDGMTIDGYFEKICRDGFEKLKPSLDGKKKSLETYEERLTYEIDKIREMGFPGYFLIVWDIIRFCYEEGIAVGPGRGSVVGSLVSYCMSITTVDPLDYDLIFERFLNPERISMPDIDLDFDPDRRAEVIEYIRQKYGEESVCQIVTFGKMKAKMAVRDIGRVLEIPLANVNKLAKMLPEGPKVDLKEELENNDELIKEIKQVENADKLMDFALKLENNVRHTSMHAAGVVIAPKKLTEFMPLYKTRDDIVSQYEKEEVEEIGLLKLDILGLKTLTIIKNILSQIKDIEGIEVDLSTAPLDDEKTYKVFQAGETDGIFQFESSGMRDFLKRSKPDKIEDLIALNALYRPGPLESGMADEFVKRKLGKVPITYIFPELEEILNDTYGIIVYQEQVMLISVTIAGFSLGKADGMRKIMGKKLEHKLVEVEKEFMEGAEKKGFNKKKCAELFSQIKTFARYGFNKSHSTAYGFLAYHTAYLKAHYPVYFMSAHLTNEAAKTSTTSKVIQYISESRKMNISILPPSINKSYENFRVESKSSIRFGLKGLKSCGDAALASILAAREAGGEFKDFSDFLTRIDLSKVNKGVVESLIKSGSMDDFGIHRSVLFASLEDSVQQAVMIAKKKVDAQKSLFGSDFALNKITINPAIVNDPEWSESELIQGEKEIAGMYLTHNPIERFSNEIQKISNTDINHIVSGEFTGEKVKIGGAFTSISQRKSKTGNFYGEMFFEDLSGRIKVLAFKKSWENFRDIVQSDVPYFLEGRLPEGEEATSIFLEDITPLEEFLHKKARKVFVKMDHKDLTDEFSDKLFKLLEKHEGTTPYKLAIYMPDGKNVSLAETGFKGINPTLLMKKEIEDLTGRNKIEIIY